jgi:peptidoglycan/xylan/chitin deacetylase (PgdA/CDA1 family)
VDIATLPSTNGTWQNFTKKITIPTNVDTMTVFHLLRGNGSLVIDDYSLIMKPIYMNPAQMLEFQTAGHELGGHTQTHVSLSTVAPSVANAELVGSWTDLLAMGAVDVKTMAYPYGDYNAAVQTMAKNAGYVAARSVDRGFNDKGTNKYELKIQQMDRTTTMADVQHWVAQAAADKTWLILMFHQEDENIAHDLGVTPQLLQQIVDYVHTANVDVVTVKEGVAQMNP